VNGDVLQFALIGAMIIGTIIAVLLGRFLDHGDNRTLGLIGVTIPQSSDVIDFSDQDIMLAPKRAKAPLPRVFEREIIISNIGFSVVDNFKINLKTNFQKAFDPEIDFVDYAIFTDPPGLKYELHDAQESLDSTELEIKFEFMNRGDKFRLRSLSSSDSRSSFKAHHPNTEFRNVPAPVPLPTVRQRFAGFLGRSRIIELGIGATTAALTGTILALIS